MDRRIRRHVARLSVPPRRVERAIREEDLAGLPEPARRYFRFAGSVGRSMAWSFQARFSGRFRMDDARPWARASAIQYNAIDPPTRLFLLGIRLWGLPIRGVDSYVGGQGRMRARLLGLKTVVDDATEATTVGELSTYLADLVWVMPSSLLAHDVTWKERDDRSFDVTLRDRGRSVTGTVVLDGRDALKEFTTTDRYYAPSDPKAGGRPERTLWSMTGEDVREIEGRKVDMKVRAVWRPADGDHPYVDFTMDDVAWNV